VRRSDHGDQTSADYLLCAAQEALLFKGNPSITTVLAHLFPRGVTGTSVLKVHNIAQIAPPRLCQRFARDMATVPLSPRKTPRCVSVSRG
jgi:hypothetical protein